MCLLRQVPCTVLVYLNSMCTPNFRIMSWDNENLLILLSLFSLNSECLHSILIYVRERIDSICEATCVNGSDDSRFNMLKIMIQQYRHSYRRSSSLSLRKAFQHVYLNYSFIKINFQVRNGTRTWWEIYQRTF